MKEFFISIGSNIDPQNNVPRCIELLKLVFPGTRFSTVYETEPVGPSGKNKFWNLCAAIPASLPAADLQKKLRDIEEKLGRIRDPKNKFAARVIDADILPQPGYTEQAFIMIPLAEIAPGEKDPASGKTFRELAEKLRGQAASFKIAGDRP